MADAVVEIPPWDDAEAQFRWLRRIISTADAILRAGEDRRGEPAELIPTLRRFGRREIRDQNGKVVGYTNPVLVSAAEINCMLENQAVAAAKTGNFRPLERLLGSDHVPVLAKETRRIIADILAGRLKKPRHRPRSTEQERRKANPKHDAADAVKDIEDTLRRWYPKKEAREIYDRAVYVAARMYKIDDEALHSYLRRPLTDHRRPTQHPRRKRSQSAPLVISQACKT